MTTIIRRYRRPRLAPLFVTVAAVILLATWLILMLWAKGGPQPVHEIVIALPAPKIAGPRA